jgi:hypothetical protein
MCETYGCIGEERLEIVMVQPTDKESVIIPVCGFHATYYIAGGHAVAKPFSQEEREEAWRYHVELYWSYVLPHLRDYQHVIALKLNADMDRMPTDIRNARAIANSY